MLCAIPHRKNKLVISTNGKTYFTLEAIAANLLFKKFKAKLYSITKFEIKKF
jgi:hypothetical protein